MIHISSVGELGGWQGVEAICGWDMGQATYSRHLQQRWNRIAPPSNPEQKKITNDEVTR